MTKKDPSKYFYSSPEIIRLAVMLYVRFPLSLRSVEDLLPFSNERLVRAVVASRAPVVTAIGHEQDVPLVDLVADLRASTPTDAAKRVVPDVGEEQELIGRCPLAEKVKAKALVAQCLLI